MKKSYILKFDQVQGDYVIVEQERQEGNLKPENKRGLFFAKRFFRNNEKNQEKTIKNQEIDSNSNFLENLDKKLQDEKQEKSQLASGLSVLSNKNLDIEIEQEDNQQQPPNSVAPSQPVQPAPSQPAPNPNNNVSVSEGVQLLAGLYNNFRILNMIYQTLRDINDRSASSFSEFISENIALQGGLLNIYYSVSGQNVPPNLDQSVPVLSSRFDEIVDVALAYVKGMRDINLRLTKLFAVEKFNRQFNLIENALSIQNDYLTGLKIQSLTLKI